MKTLPFIVTGTPRSATRYTARLLHAMKVPCTHEHILRPLATFADAWRWYQTSEYGESSWMAWAILPVFPESVPVLHSIRDPWKVIDSLTNRNSILKDTFNTDTMKSIRDTIRTFCPRVFEYTNRADRAAAFVVEWNRLIANRVSNRMVYCVERLDVPMVRRMLHHIGYERDDQAIADGLQETSTSTNAGYTIIDTPGISDPVVAKYIRDEIAQGQKVFTRRIKNTPDRSSMAELANRISPDLLNEVNAHAVHYGYEPATTPAQVD